MKKVCSELIDFFEGEEGWDKDEILSDYVAYVLEKNGIKNDMDEITLFDGEHEHMNLADFAEELFDKIAEGVCNVIRTA